jgi:hypothetical protein
VVLELVAQLLDFSKQGPLLNLVEGPWATEAQVKRLQMLQAEGLYVLQPLHP